jgi:hypothetical protein
MTIVSWWEISHAEGMRKLTVEQAPNNREFIRLDGRTIAKPLDPTEGLREVLIEGRKFVIRRNPGGFGFDLEYPEPVDAPPELATPTESHPLVATMRGVSVELLREMRERIRLSWLLWAGLALAIFSMLYMAIPKYEQEAVKRVKLLVAEMALGPGPQEELAMGIWLRNTRTPERDELLWCVSHFPEFRNAKNLRRKFSSWKIVESAMVEDAKVPTALVTIEVEGVPYKMLVPERRTITWAE